MQNMTAVFEGFFKKIKNVLNWEFTILWLVGIVLAFALIIFSNHNKLPLGAGDLVFFALLTLLVALYRPQWVFLLFVALIPLESIIFASGFLPLQLRPYQFVGAILALAVFVLWLLKRLKFSLLKPIWLDYLIFSLIPLGILSAINSSARGVSLKNTLILLSFAVLYYIARNFLRKKSDIIKTFFFFLGSNLVVLGYGFCQVFTDKFLAYRQAGGARSFEVMFGRPNSTFTEADWLGIFLCFALAVIFSGVHFLSRNKDIDSGLAGLGKWILQIFIFLNITLLILTLSRSAWIGAGVVTIAYLFFNLFEKKREGIAFTPRRFSRQLLAIFFILIVALAAIQFGKLSKFDIFDRARSAATNEQKITVACESGLNVPATVSNINELGKYNCQFINLEEIEFYRSQRKFITEIFRKDPNILTRGAIYKKSFELIREHPILGVGFGTITQTLGTDQRGAGLNESNIFLQVWAGSGILGLLAFTVLIIYLFVHSMRRFSPLCLINIIFGHLAAQDEFENTLSMFSILGILALIIPNLFNAGLFMGILWLGVASIVSMREIIRLNPQHYENRC